MRTIRASACPRVMQCPASAYLSDDEIAIDESSDAAKLGTAVHAIAKDIVEGGLTVGPPVEPYAERYGVTDITELRVLTAYVRQAWFGTPDEPGLKVHFPNPAVECKMSTVICDEDGNPELKLTGTLDLGQWAECEILIGDYKSGRKEDTGQHEDQLAAYGKLAADIAAAPATVVKVFPIWLRDKYYYVREYTTAELDEWSIRLRDKLREGPNSYCTGDHCHFCPKRHSCVALRQTLQAAATMFALEPTAPQLWPAIVEGSLLPAASVLPILERAKQLANYADKLFKGLKELIKEHGPIKLDNGQTIDLKERAGKKIIDPTTSFDVIAEYLNWEDFMPAVTIGKTKLEKAIKGTVERGKGKLWEEALAKLEAAGAISQGKPSYSLTTTKAPKIEVSPEYMYDPPLHQRKLHIAAESLKPPAAKQIETTTTDEEL